MRLFFRDRAEETRAKAGRNSASGQADPKAAQTATKLWRVPVSGGQAEQLAKGVASIGRWSLDGKDIYFVGPQAQANSLWKLSLTDRSERPVLALASKRGQLAGMGLATDGRFLYFTWKESLGDIWVAAVTSGAGH